ncbi:hypothetical protein BJX63DRAFT_417140 [Aspergillus granulosus]|uniref:Uncharacterized protein n=1 Tax=Aspergillus granulosus TaxID=176169 RepID=A0ABR4GR77_9EURO
MAAGPCVLWCEDLARRVVWVVFISQLEELSLGIVFILDFTVSYLFAFVTTTRRHIYSLECV